MKLKIFLTALLAALAALAASAQDNLKKAVNDFITDGSLTEYIKITQQIDAADAGKNNASSFYKYDFELPKSKIKKFGILKQAFNKDAPKAYKVQVRNAGVSSSELASIGYGKNLDKTYSFGSYIKRNYMIMYVRDPQDNNRRSVYAIVWYDGKKKGSLAGSVVTFSSLDPQKLTKSMRQNDLSKQYESLKDLPERLEGLKDLPERLEGLSQLTQVNSSMDFLQRFGSLRAIYKKSVASHEELDIQTGIVNRILSLCKNYGNLLSKSERTVCAEGLDELRKISTDKYLAALLDEAVISVLDK